MVSPHCFHVDESELAGLPSIEASVWPRSDVCPVRKERNGEMQGIGFTRISRRTGGSKLLKSVQSKVLVIDCKL